MMYLWMDKLHLSFVGDEVVTVTSPPSTEVRVERIPHV